MSRRRYVRRKRAAILVPLLPSVLPAAHAQTIFAATYHSPFRPAAPQPAKTTPPRAVPIEPKGVVTITTRSFAYSYPGALLRALRQGRNQSTLRTNADTAERFPSPPPTAHALSLSPILTGSAAASVAPAFLSHPPISDLRSAVETQRGHRHRPSQPISAQFIPPHGWDSLGADFVATPEPGTFAYAVIALPIVVYLRRRRNRL